MRILKYLFLLLLLSMVALSIFIATLKGPFSVEKSIVINSQKALTYEYVNNQKNWKDWNYLAIEDPNIDINYSKTTKGNGSSINWNGKEGNGKLKTIKLKANENIIQTLDINGNTAEVAILFRDTLGKTKVTMKAKGNMNYLMKIKNFIYEGPQVLFGNFFEKNLYNLDKKLDLEINTFAVDVNGVVNKPETYYLSQTFTSQFSKIEKNSEIVFSKIKSFCKSNKLTIGGKPFTIYHTHDTISKLSKISFCIPIQSVLSIPKNNEIVYDTLKKFEAVKTTLKGRHTFMKQAYKKTSLFFKKNNLKTNPIFSHLEIYTVGKNDNGNPSKWETEIYFPTRKKVQINKVLNTPVSINKDAPTNYIEKEEAPEIEEVAPIEF